MSDYYAMLDLPRTATPEAIRCAYLARMKVLHPDCRGSSPAVGPSAADLNLAYWTLRDPQRRAAYDLILAPLPRESRRIARRGRRSGQVIQHHRQTQKRSYHPRRSGYSARARAGVAMMFVVLAAAAGAGTMLLWRSDQAQAAWAKGVAADADTKRNQRRVLDDALASAAAAEFQAILNRTGFSGASLYGRQCFEELSTQPNMAMAEYCLAFDRTAAEWEGALVTRSDGRRYFDMPARLSRYQRLADNLRDGPVRQAIVAEAAFLTSH